MKKHLTLIIICVLTITTYGQNKQGFHQKIDSLQLENLQNHNHLDTLWVLDSSQLFTYYLNQEMFFHERTYKVLSRNGRGNLISALDWADENFPDFPKKSSGKGLKIVIRNITMGFGGIIKIAMEG